METKKEEKLGFIHYMKVYTQEFTDLFQFHILPYLHLMDICSFRRVSKRFKAIVEGTVIEEAFDDDTPNLSPPDVEMILRNLKFRKYSFNEKYSFSIFLDNLDRIPKKLKELQLGFVCGDIEQQTLMLLSPFEVIQTLTIQGRVSRARWLSVLLRNVQITHLNFSEVEFNSTWEVDSFKGVKSIRIQFAMNGPECTDVVSRLPIKSFFVTLGHITFNKSLFKGFTLNESIQKLGYELSNDLDVRKKELKSITKILLNNKVLRELSIFGRIHDKLFKHLLAGLWGNTSLRRLEFGISLDKFSRKSFEKVTEIMKAKPALVLVINTMYTFPLEVALSMIGLQSDVERKGEVKISGVNKQYRNSRQRVFIQNKSVRNEYRGIDAFLTCLEVTMQKNEELEKKVQHLKKKLKKKKDPILE